MGKGNGDEQSPPGQSGRAPTHYVGVGASAGGLEAIEAVFDNMPGNTGLAFIVIQHLSPDYKSLMVELLSKRTQMPVYRAEDGLLVEADAVYLIPPKKNLTIFHGKLLLTAQNDHPRGLNLPIDVFFRSLAEDQGEKAIGVILSGTGSDGMRGVRAIKEAGGMVMVQDEDSAKFDGMPKSAISTGLADFILPPEEMPPQLLSFTKHPYASNGERSDALLSEEDDLTRMFSMLRERHKVDFTYYKPSTVIRRLERRMTVNQVEDLGAYVKLLQSYPRELSTLYQELLIGVTNFFRDPEAFNFLGEKALLELIEKNPGRELRFWVAGCSTGEEAYSLAILSQECLRRLGRTQEVKIFATDVDRDAVARAGNGVYPESIAADLSPELLSRYFYRREENFQVARGIREMVVFAQHNIVKDPPFTNIDLISCRNLLIYLQPVLQRKVLDLFNFSLCPQGLLFLGSSETVGELGDLFEPLHHKWKIYQSRGKRRPPAAGTGDLLPFEMRGRVVRPSISGGRRMVRAQEEERMLERLLLALHGEYVPLVLLVNESLELQHSVGDTGGLFQLPPGKMANDVSKMAAKELAIPLTTGIQKAFKTGKDVKFSNVRLRHGDAVRTLNMRIRPLPEKRGQDSLVAVLLEDTAQPEGAAAAAALSEPVAFDMGREAEQRILDLEQELQFNRENLQATIEELETSNEELQATNEELLASNEELQSTNEELQSVNEELYTVNAEYQTKILELTELNNDVDNMLLSTEIAILFVDENLEIRKYTPKVTELIKIIESDLGRPIHDLAPRLQEVDLLEAIRDVQRSGHLREAEIRTTDGKWYLMRVLPYRVSPETVSGVLVAFVDIGPLKEMQEDLLREQQDLRGKVRELNLLYGMSTIAVEHGSSLEEMARAVVKRLQSVWHSPEAVATRVALDDLVVESDGFAESQDVQVGTIFVHGKEAGRIEVHHFEDDSEHGHEFTQEDERRMIDAVAEQLGRISQRLLGEAGQAS